MREVVAPFCTPVGNVLSRIIIVNPVYTLRPLHWALSSEIIISIGTMIVQMGKSEPITVQSSILDENYYCSHFQSFVSEPLVMIGLGLGPMIKQTQLLGAI